MPRQAADGLLRALGAEVGIPDLRLDEAGCCTLAFDEVVVNLEVDDDSRHLLLYANLGPAPATDAAAALYEDLLDGNLFWRGTGGATLGLDRPGGRILLMQGFPADRVTEADFKAGVERFVDVAEGWKARVGEAVDAAAGTAATVPQAESAEGRPSGMVDPGMMA